MLDIRIERTTRPKELPGEDNPLVFGKIYGSYVYYGL